MYPRAGYMCGMAKHNGRICICLGDLTAITRIPWLKQMQCANKERIYHQLYIPLPTAWAWVNDLKNSEYKDASRALEKFLTWVESESKEIK